MLDKGADPNQQYGYYGFSAIHTACISGNLPIIKRLLLAGASVNSIATDKRTPIFIVVDKTNQELVNFLLRKGAIIPDWKIGYSGTIQERARKKKISIVKT